MKALVRGVPAGLVLAICLMLAATGCGSSERSTGPDVTSGAAEAAADPTTVDAAVVRATPVAINFTMQPVFAPLLYGDVEGIFERHGFDVDITPTQGSDQAMTFVNAGRADFAVLDFDTYAEQAVEGKTRAKAVFVWLDRTSLAIVSTEPLDGPDSLTGKSFGTTGFSAGRKIIPYIMEQNGVDPGGVRVEALDFSVLYPSLFQGEIDTAEIHTPGSWQNLLVSARRQGRRVFLKHMSDWGYDGYEKVIVASERALRDPDAVKRFVIAAAESLDSAVERAGDDEIYELIRESQPSSERDAIVADWHDFKDALGTPGAFRRSEVAKSLERLHEFGAIESVPDASTLYDNQYIGE